MSSGTRQVLFVGSCCLLVAFKLWLILSLRLQADGSAGLDDRLFAEYAQSIIAGDWLGEYDQRTLAKGQFYSVFLALCFHAGVPSIFAQQVLHAAACVILMIAVRPLIRNRLALTVTFFLLLYDPFLYSDTSVRITRETIYTSLTILILACAIALLLRPERSPKRLAVWSIGLGLTLGGFWTTREEGIWLIPALSLLMVATLGRMWRRDDSVSIAQVCLLILPLVLWGAVVFAVMGVNYAHYGVFDTVEFKNKAFRRADAAIARIEAEPWRPYVLVSRKSREALFAVSPAFAGLKPHFEGPVGINWGRIARLNSYAPNVAEDDIAGGWFSWALRDVAAAAGHHTTARDAEWFYDQVADEINAACDDGRIPCRGKRRSIVPVLPWRSEYIPLMGNRLATALKNAFQISTIAMAPQSGDPEPYRQDVFEDITHSPLLTTLADRSLQHAQWSLDKKKYAIMESLRRRYAEVFRYLTPIALGTFLIVFVVQCVVGIRRRTFSPSPFAVICAVLLVGIVSRLTMLLYITASSFYTLTPSYIGPIYSMTILFDCFAIAYFSTESFGKLRGPDTRPGV